MAQSIKPSPGRKSDKLWRDAIHLALKRPYINPDGTPDPQGRKRLQVAAEALVDAACAGDVAAMREVGDRMDGKPAQAIVGSDDAPPVKTIMEVVWGGSNGAR